MSSVPVRGTITQARSKSFDDFQDTNHFDESLKLLDQLFEARLVDRISRAIDKKVKEEYIHLYQQKLNSLHERLRRIAKEALEQWKSKGKGKTGVHSRQWSKFIRNIQTKYCEVILEGSFKHIKKICLLLNLNIDSSKLDPIDIQQWANTCLYSQSDTNCC